MHVFMHIVFAGIQKAAQLPPFKKTGLMDKFSALVASDYSSIIRKVDQTNSKNFPAVSGHGVSIIFGADLPVTKQATQGHPFPAMVCAQARPLYATTSN